MSLYDELLQFQILPHARNDWAEYRTAVTAYLLQHTEPQSSVAVFGAGRCNDIDLREFRKHFSSVTLIDSNFFPVTLRALHRKITGIFPMH